MNMGKMWQKIY